MRWRGTGRSNTRIAGGHGGTGAGNAVENGAYIFLPTIAAATHRE